MLETLVGGIDTALGNSAMAVPLLQNVFPLEKMPKLDEIDLDRAVTQEEYRVELDRLQEKLGHLHNKLYRKKVPVIIAYEGWAAGPLGMFLGVPAIAVIAFLLDNVINKKLTEKNIIILSPEPLKIEKKNNT